MQQNKYHNIRHNNRKIIEGYKALYKLCPSFIVWSIMRGFFQSIIPYFVLFMTTSVINSVFYSDEIINIFEKLCILAAGSFILSIIKELVQQKNVYWNEYVDIKFRYLLFEAKKNMNYELVESNEVSELCSRIELSRNSNNGGIWKLVESLSFFFSALTDIVVSFSLTLRLFLSSPSHQTTVWDYFFNSHFSLLTIVIILIIHNCTNSSLIKKKADALRAIDTKYSSENLKFNIYRDIEFTMDMPFSRIAEYIISRMKTIAHNHRLSEICHIQVKSNIYILILEMIERYYILLLISYKVFMGLIGIGDMLLFRRTINKFVSGINLLIGTYENLIQNNENMDIIFSLLEISDKKTISHSTNTSLANTLLSEKNIRLDFRNVSYKYKNATEYSLKNLSFSFCKGDKIAIVGENGSGKTTLAKILAGLYKNYEGDIFINGINIRNLDEYEYRSIFSTVFQDYDILSFTIGNNISSTYSYDENIVSSALQKVDMLDLINDLPRKYDTFIHNNFEWDGIELSGGEEQKIAISRSVYKNSLFDVYDEPTASLDPLSEIAMYHKLNDNKSLKGVVFISHRFASCKLCPHILVLKDGFLVGEGNHNYLVNNNPFYKELWNSQASFYQSH